MTPGVRLGVDVGQVRVGVAISDPNGVLATPLATLKREKTGADLDELARTVAERNVIEVIVGLPLSLSGQPGRAAIAAQAYASRLAKRIAPTPVHFVDERLTTVIASRVLRAQGVRGRRQRKVVDQVAAVEILQAWLDSHAQ